MSGALSIVSLFPERLNIHGDAENADVLRVRAGWRGVDATVTTLATASDAEGLRPDVLTIGAGFDSDAPDILSSLLELQDRLRVWVESGTVLLAVGLGWEMMSRSLELHPGRPLTGVGVFTGRTVASARHVGRIAVDSEWGPLTGYEYHLRDYVLGPDERPLGTLASGTGNRAVEGAASVPGPEGAVRGTAYGTGIRGPVLARNPVFADHLLDLAAAHAGVTFPSAAPDQLLTTADDHAAKANVIVRRALGLSA
jgi:CobQ-like glutamine amidotransferase family enzyme